MSKRSSRHPTTRIAAVLVAIGTSALAQGIDVDSETLDPYRSEVDDLRPEAQSGNELPAQQPPAQQAPSAQHRVVPGDTLWDITQSYLGNSWYWPKVWSYNPQIANPHWIYPGDFVKFYGGGDEAPSQIAISRRAPIAQQAPNSDFAVAGPIGYQGKGSAALEIPGFVTPDDFKSAGTIIGSFAATSMLSYPQTFYARFSRAPRAGENYVVLRPTTELKDPESGDTLGRLMSIRGAARILRMDSSGVATMEITKQQDEILRGDILGPYGEPLTRPLIDVAAKSDILGGRLVSSFPTTLTLGGQHMFAIVNRGTDAGVENGNTFTIWRRHDSLAQEVLIDPALEDRNFPKEDIGSCVVIDVRKAASVCVLTRTLQAVVRSDHAEIFRTGSSPADTLSVR